MSEQPSPGGPREEQQEAGRYDQLARRAAELLETGRKTLDEALKKAGEELTAAGDFSREQAERIAAYVRRDVEQVGRSALKARDAMRQAADPQRVGAGVQSVVSRLLQGVAGTLTELAERTEKQLEYRTGEVTSAGTLTCKECGAELHLAATVRIPPCPKCHKTLFRKSY